MSFTIRRAAAEDAQALSLLGGATFLETYAGVIHGADIVPHCARMHAPGYYAAWLEEPGGALWLAEHDGAPIGYAGLSRPDLPEALLHPGDVELKRIYVLSRFHRARLGQRLMDAALMHARHAGAQRVLLGVFGGNAAAQAFYARMGFTRVGTRTFHVGAHDYDDLVLGRAP